MNQTTHYILGIYQINLILRDSLEYMMPNKEFKLEAYNHRERGLKSLLNENAPFGQFVKNNGEKAEEVMKNLQRFYDEVYGENSSIVKVHGDKVEVDASKHTIFYEMVVGIFQTIEDIMQGFLKHARENGTYEEYLEKAINSNEYFFRAASHLVIVHDLIKLFNEFQVAYREAKGEKSPVVNFINDDINKYFGFILFQKKHNRVKDASYHAMLDKVMMLIEAMNGRRQLPEGVTFPSLFSDVEQAILKEVEKSEVLWKTDFAPLIKDYIEYNQKHFQNFEKPEERLS